MNGRRAHPHRRRPGDPARGFARPGPPLRSPLAGLRLAQLHLAVAGPYRSDKRSPPSWLRKKRPLASAAV